jgi:hypothetical protein
MAVESEDTEHLHEEDVLENLVDGRWLFDD